LIVALAVIVKVDTGKGRRGCKGGKGKASKGARVRARVGHC
jgi:hypothetical protein